MLISNYINDVRNFRVFKFNNARLEVCEIKNLPYDNAMSFKYIIVVCVCFSLIFFCILCIGLYLYAMFLLPYNTR